MKLKRLQKRSGKRLSDYLDLMKSAMEQIKWLEVKRLGETALKKLPHFPATPMDKFILYYRLGCAYNSLRYFSLALETFHKAYGVALKHRFGPEYPASVSYMMASNFLILKNTGLALSQYRLVEQYYQKHGYKKSPMDLTLHIFTLLGLGFCYLYQNNAEKTREILEEKLPSYQTTFSKTILVFYQHLKGEYLTKIKDYAGAKLSFQEVIRISENLTLASFFGKIHLAVLNILEGQPGSAITLLKTILKETARLKKKPTNNVVICETLLLLSKGYALIGLQDKADIMEKRLKVRVKELDITWFYVLSKEVEQIYQQMESSPAALKNWTEKEPALSVISRTREHLNDQMSSYKPDSETESRSGGTIIGKSPVMQEMYQLIEKVAPTNLPVLIYGETGTGKELVARAIHQRSLRSRHTWLACNTGAIPETLLESELFGYIRGAFTGAQTDKKGYIELASDGTLFLDEIGNMSLGMQQKLLRVMEDNLLWRLGTEKPVQVNTRFVFASNENMEELVKAKRFREDLYYRINTIIITLPPLRERKEDIPLLVQYFLKKYALPRQALPAVSSNVLAILTAYPWPGNVRELENEIKRIGTLYPGTSTITETML